VATEAADLVRTERRLGVEVTDTKSSPIDIVTQVDTAAEKLIYERLLTERPDDGFVGEEGGSAISTSGVTWIVDPIDGTVNFLYGIPQYAVSIAASIADTVVAGVVVNVVTEECFVATLGGGSHCNGDRLSVRGPAPHAECLVLTGYHYVAEVRAKQAAAIARLVSQVRDVRRFGSAALDLCAVGAGRADAYVEEGLHPWDRAAGALVASEAGAIVRVVTGAGGKDAVVCAPAHGFDAFTDLVTDCGFLQVPGERRS
jgi:myo-inositol-1(or 4)-monophosphatase